MATVSGRLSLTGPLSLSLFNFAAVPLPTFVAFWAVWPFSPKWQTSDTDIRHFPLHVRSRMRQQSICVIRHFPLCSQMRQQSTCAFVILCVQTAMGTEPPLPPTSSSYSSLSHQNRHFRTLHNDDQSSFAR